MVKVLLQFECPTWYSNLERTLGTSLLLLVLAHNNILHSAIKHNISFLVKKESDQNQISYLKIYQELTSKSGPEFKIKLKIRTDSEIGEIK